MNPIVGWVLVVVALAAGWVNYGWQGVVTIVTVAVFWLLLQFNRSVKVMKNAGHAPIGHVGSAVMLNSRLRKGMPMIKIVGLTHSLGRRVAETPETWAWQDEGGSSVALVMENGRLSSWHLTRPAPEGEEEAPGAAANP